MAEEAAQVESAPQETTETSTTTESSAPDLGAQIAALEQKLEERLPAPTQEEPTGSLADILLGAEGDDDYEDLLVDEESNQENGAEQQLDPALEQIVQRLQGVENHLIGKTEMENQHQLNSLEEKYPDIREHLNPIAGVLNPLSERLGFDAILVPEFVEMAYKAIKADAASAEETPAEEARNRGASLETDAGAGNQSGEESYADQAAREIANAGGPESVFFGT